MFSLLFCERVLFVFVISVNFYDFVFLRLNETCFFSIIFVRTGEHFSSSFTNFSILLDTASTVFKIS